MAEYTKGANGELIKTVAQDPVQEVVYLNDLIASKAKIEAQIAEVDAAYALNSNNLQTQLTNVTGDIAQAQALGVANSLETFNLPT